MIFPHVLIGAVLASSTLALPNTVAINNLNLRTQAPNGTWFIVPVDAVAVQKSIPYPLLPVPTQDASLFPRGFPLDKHPVLVSNFCTSDIWLSVLQIESLMSGSVYVPYVNRLKDGKTPFQYSTSAIIGGKEGKTLMGTVPSLVSTLLGGNVLLEGQFVTDTAPFSEISPGQCSAQGKLSIVPNPLSGPGVIESIYVLNFTAAETPLYTEHTFHSGINQPVILNNGMCLRNTIYFNETFVDPVLRTGRVTLYSPPLPTGFSGVYQEAGGFLLKARMLDTMQRAVLQRQTSRGWPVTQCS